MSSHERKTILLVEDEGIIAMAAAKTIEGFGYRVIVANSGAKAVRLALDDKHIGLILMDINLGKGIDGTEAARQILSKRTIPIVFLTSHSETEYVNRVKEITRYGYVIKGSGDVVLQSSIEMAFKLFDAHEHVERKNLELAQINRRLGEKEEEYRLLFESAPSGIFIAQDGTLKLANPAALEIVGHPIERLASEHFASFIHPDDRDMVQARHFRRLRDETLETDYPFRVVTAEGRIKWVVITSTPILWRGKAASLHYILDVTERKRAEEALRESEAKYRAAFLTSPDAININAMDGRYVAVNEGFIKLTGFAREDVIGVLSSELGIWAIPEDRTKLIKDLTETGVVENMESVFRCRDGSLKNALMSARIINIGSEPYILSITHDITRRKEAEEKERINEKKYRILADNTYDWEYWVDPGHRFIYCSPSCERITGHKAQEFSDDPDLLDRIIHPDHRIAFTLHQNSEPGSGTRWNDELEFLIVRPDGAERWIGHVCSAIYDEDGLFVGIRGSNRDITDRKKAEEQIKSLLAEKELLLKEVHHRIKNNMNVIMSLLSLQSSTLRNNPSTVAALQDARSRVRSMMILYEKIYRSSDFRKISTKQYIASLIDEIVSNFPNRESVTLRKHVDDFLLDAKILSPVGIILNELLTNAMKHAFTGRDKGEISVSLGAEGNHVALIVQDNGIGIPESTGIADSTGFGLQVVEMLTEQLEGAIRLERNKGSTFTLEFDI